MNQRITNRSTRHRARRRGSALSFDDRNLAVETQLNEQVQIAAGNQATALALKAALDLRQAARQTAFTDAQQHAETAAANLSDAQLATQTLLKGIVQAKLAHQKALDIRDKLGQLARQAYETAEALSQVITTVDLVLQDIQSRVAKNQLLTPVATKEAPQIQADVQMAFAAALQALQDSVRAFAAASVAADLAGDPIKLGVGLLALIFDQQAENADYYTHITKVSALRLWTSDPMTMHQVAAFVSKRETLPGLLNLLSAVKTVTQLKETICNDALTVTILEDNQAQSEVDRTTQKLALLDAALLAADAALG